MALSADRTRVAWIPSRQPGSPGLAGDVWILDLRSIERRRVTTGVYAWCVSWSPDGRRMALTIASATHSTGSDILIISAETGRTEHLIEAGSNRLYDPVRTADSQRVVYSTARYEGEQAPYRWIVNRLESFDLRTRRRSLFLDLLPPVGAREVKDHPLTMAVANLTFSPDGRVLLFVTGPGPRINRYSSGVPTFLVEGHSPAWHPDGRSISFARTHGCSPYPCAGPEEIVNFRLP